MGNRGISRMEIVGSLYDSPISIYIKSDYGKLNFECPWKRAFYFKLCFRTHVDKGIRCEGV